MISIAKVTDIIRTVANNHPQIKSYGVNPNLLDFNESEFEVFNESSVGLEYPCLFVMYQQGTVNTGEVTRSINLMIADLSVKLDNTDTEVHLDMDNSVISACELIAFDLFASLKLAFVDAGLTVNDGLTVTPFKERFKDDLAGVVMQLQTVTELPVSVCYSPTNTQTTVKFYFGEGGSVTTTNELTTSVDSPFVVPSFGSGHGLFWVATPTPIGKWRRSGIDFGVIASNDLFSFAGMTTISGDDYYLYVTNYATDKDVETTFRP